MAYELIDPHSADDKEPCAAPESISTEESTSVSLVSNPLYSEMSLPVLAAHCLWAIDNYRRGEPYTEMYGLELLHRAIMLSDQEAWALVQHCFGGMVHGWVRRHPQRAAACRLESEENYVAQAFERFWQATAFNQQLEFSTLAAALQYLRACLNGAILDTLRAYLRPKEVSLLEPGEPGELYGEDQADSSEVWEILHSMLPNRREQRLAYLLYYCGLKPREIVHFCPREWRDIREIYRLRRSILERLLRNADLLRWRLS